MNLKINDYILVRNRFYNVQVDRVIFMKIRYTNNEIFSDKGWFSIHSDTYRSIVNIDYLYRCNYFGMDKYLDIIEKCKTNDPIFLEMIYEVLKQKYG